jgi:large conductance mechanosensitive channel
MSAASNESRHLSASGAVHAVGHQLGGFRKFILRGNVVDLAVGIVIGAAFSNVVQSLVKDFITPLIGIFGGRPDFATYAVVVRGARFAVGDFVNVAISFLLMAAVIYFLVVLPVTRLMDRFKPERQPAPTKECPECLSKIPKDARRCPECTAQLLPPSAEVAAAMRAVVSPSGEQEADEAERVLVERLHGGSMGQGAVRQQAPSD